MDILLEIKKGLEELNIEGYLVGGYLRDKYFNVKSMDMDMVVSANISGFINYLEKKGYKFFVLNDEEQIYRGKVGDYILDVTTIKGDIKNDLLSRDFTINSLAYNILKDEELDLNFSLKDIKAKILRSDCLGRIEEDPIRILRGYRFILKYGLIADKKTKGYFKSVGPKIMESKKERKFVEFMKLMQVDKEGNCFSLMDNGGFLESFIPYAKENKTIGKCKYHVEDALTHMDTTYKTFRKLINGEIKINIPIDNFFKESISGFDLKIYMSLAAYLHDIGKFKSYKKKGDKITFYDHQKKGKEIAEKFLKKNGFPNKGIIFIDKLIEGHMEPLMLFKNNLKDTATSELKFFKKWNKFAPYIIMLSFCDVFATRLFHDSEKEIDSYKKYIENLFLEYNRYLAIVKNPVISSLEVIEYGNVTGVQIKNTIELINDNMYLGLIRSKKEAIYLIKQMEKKDE